MARGFSPSLSVGESTDKSGSHAADDQERVPDAGAASAGGPPGYRAGAPAPRTSLLGTSQITQPPPWWGTRRDRYRRRQASSAWLVGAARTAAGLPEEGGGGWVRPARPARCRWRVTDLVGVHHQPGSPAHWSGLERCASIWACPVCSAVIRARRADEIDQAAVRWEEAGGRLAMITVTIPHEEAQPLAETLDQVLSAWRRMTAGTPWQRLKRRYGVRGYVRAVEVTYGCHGWHPHIHALFFLDGEIDPGSLWAELHEQWASGVRRMGGGIVSIQHGVRVQMAGSVAAAYVAKVQEHDRPPTGIASEISRGDLKAARTVGGRVPFELLDHRDYRHLWLEYVDATHRRQCITWSKGLRELVHLEEELSDEEVIADAEQADLVMLLPGHEYDRIRDNPVELAALLEVYEFASLDSDQQLWPQFRSVDACSTGDCDP